MISTAQIKLLPTEEQEEFLQSTMKEYISCINDLVDYFLGQGKVPKMSTKDFQAVLPSTLKCQALVDAKSVHKKSRKTKRQHVLKKKVAVWNNQNYRIGENKILFPVWNNRSTQISVKAEIPQDLLASLTSSKLAPCVSQRNAINILPRLHMRSRSRSPSLSPRPWASTWASSVRQWPSLQMARSNSLEMGEKTSL